MKKLTSFHAKILALSVMMAITVTACGGESSSSNSPVVDKVADKDEDKEVITMPIVQLETSMGEITLEINKKDSPKSAENFLNYVKSGHYNGTIFHRVIDGFMVQGGGFDNTMTKKTTQAPIENEADNGLKNDIGTLAMARTGDPHSATNQFFINVNDNDFLNHTAKNSNGWGYAVFGKVTDGMDVVNKIKGVATNSNVPIESVTIISATVIKE